MSEVARRRWSYFLISSLGLALSIWGIERYENLSEPPPAALQEISYPARVGSAVAGSPAELRFLAETRRPGSVVEVRSAGRTSRVRLQPQLTRLYYLLVLIEGLLFFAVNLVIFCPRVDRGPVRDLYWCTLLYGVALMIGGLYYPRSPAWTERVLPLVWIACMISLPVLFLHMALAFPRRRPILDRHPGFMRILAAFALVLFVWWAGAALLFFHDPRPATWGILRFPRSLWGIFLVGAVGLGCLVLYRSGRRVELSREREQTRWILWGIAIGVTPYVFLRTLPKLVGIQSAIPPELDRVFELAIPIAFALAVVRYRFLDIDIIIRRSLIYGILAGVLAGAYLLVGTFAGERLIRRFPDYTGAIRILSVAIPVILYTPTRRWIGRWVDRTFFKIQYNYAQALAVFQEEIRRGSSQQEIAALLQGFLKVQLGLQEAAVLITGDGSLISAGDWDESVVEMFAEPGRLFGDSRRAIAAPNSTSLPEMETRDFPEALRQAGVRVALPLLVEERCVGAIVVGEKISERRFVEEDLKLLYAVRSETGAAIERVELVQRAAGEALARKELEELERMKSDFFSRVAHDLRTPLTSIRWTVQNMLDGVAGSPDPGHVPHLKAIHAAANQLSRLVDNLLDWSRLEHPPAAIELGPVDLPVVVEEARQMVAPIAAARNVRFETRVVSSPPPIRGNRDRVREILVNLLENAVRYSPDAGLVEISVELCASGRVAIGVRDHGPGLAPEDGERIFKRFGQGRPSPYSRQGGFGLGLYVARSYLDLMNGTIHAGNDPEGGARFTCALSRWEEP